MKKIFILKKPEVYSFDELSFIKKIVEQSDSSSSENKAVLEKLNKMLLSIEETKENTAVFFMPEATYAVFSIFQGETAICDFTQKDSQQIIDILNSENDNSEIKLHISKKLKILNDFFKDGNSAKPVPSQASEFIELVICN
ncbi:MAG: hypothetical protein MR911_00900 [Spirochaetia bacterium]|nr:hypothetical protein [Spirochaetia bacterium]MCI6546925.1 hypothetical protein [Spirochaetia bacterium]